MSVRASRATPRCKTAERGVRLFLRIDDDPGVLSRVLEPFAVEGYAPRTLIVRPAAGGTAFLAGEFEGPEEPRAAVLAERLRQMPCVISARLSRRHVAVSGDDVLSVQNKA